VGFSKGCAALACVAAAVGAKVLIAICEALPWHDALRSIFLIDHVPGNLSTTGLSLRIHDRFFIFRLLHLRGENEIVLVVHLGAPAW